MDGQTITIKVGLIHTLNFKGILSQIYTPVPYFQVLAWTLFLFFNLQKKTQMTVTLVFWYDISAKEMKNADKYQKISVTHKNVNNMCNKSSCRNFKTLMVGLDGKKQEILFIKIDFIWVKGFGRKATCFLQRRSTRLWAENTFLSSPLLFSPKTPKLSITTLDFSASSHIFDSFFNFFLSTISPFIFI